MPTNSFNWIGTSDAVVTANGSVTAAITSPAGITRDTGGVNVTVKATAAGNGGAEPGDYRAGTSNWGANVPANPDGISRNSALYFNSTSGTGAVGRLDVTFAPVAGSGNGENVENATFIISNIDRGQYREAVTVQAWDAAGNPVTVGMATVSGTAREVAVTGSGTTSATATAVDANYAFDDTKSDPENAVRVTFGGPVARIEISYARPTSVAGGNSPSYVNISDIVFDASDAVPCFAADVLIDTGRGPVRAGDLAVGDMLRTRDSGLQPIRWIASRRIGGFAGREHLRPIRIRAGALGPGLPAADLIVSPQHRVLVRSGIARRLLGSGEVLVAARHLCRIEGIAPAADMDEITYVHLLLDAHQVIFANGAEAESLFVGAEALKSVGAAARAEILALFPQLQEAGHVPAPARPLIAGRMARQLAQRHLRNARPLVAGSVAGATALR